MRIFEHLPAFLVAIAVLAVVPGPATALVVRQTVRGGRGLAAATTAGNEVGIYGWAVASAVGLAALVAASQLAYDILRITGAVVLVGLGVQTLLESRRARSGSGRTDLSGVSAGPVVEPSRWAAFRIGLASNLANPKAAVFAFSFYPQFIPDGAPVLTTTLALAALQVVVDGGYYLLLASMVDNVRAFFASDRVRRRLERVTGGVLIGLGVHLATDSR